MGERIFEEQKEARQIVFHDGEEIQGARDVRAGKQGNEGSKKGSGKEGGPQIDTGQEGK